MSLDSELLAEVRGARLPRGELSRVVEEALRVYLRKPLSPEEREMRILSELKEIKLKVWQKAQLYGAAFKKAVHDVKFRGVPHETSQERLLFWGEVLKELEGKEKPPATPKEKEGT